MIYSPVDGQLRSVQLPAVINHVAVDFMCRFLFGHTFNFSGANVQGVHSVVWTQHSPITGPGKSFPETLTGPQDRRTLPSSFPLIKSINSP